MPTSRYIYSWSGGSDGSGSCGDEETVMMFRPDVGSEKFKRFCKFKYMKFEMKTPQSQFTS